MNRVRRYVGVGLVASVAVVLSALHVRHAVVGVGGVGGVGRVGVILEAGVPFLFAVVLAAAAGWLLSAELTDTDVARVGVGVLLGVGVSFGVGAFTVGHRLLRGEVVHHLPFIVANTATAGAMFGLLLGVYDTRVRQEQRRRATTHGQLTKERDRLAALFEAAPNPVIRFRIHDGKPIAEDVNRSFERPSATGTTSSWAAPCTSSSCRRASRSPTPEVRSTRPVGAGEDGSDESDESDESNTFD